MPYELPVGEADVGRGSVGPGLESEGLSCFGDKAAIRYALVDTIKSLPGAGVQVVVDTGLGGRARVAARRALVNIDACAGSALAGISGCTLACE